MVMAQLQKTAKKVDENGDYRVENVQLPDKSESF